MDSLDDNVRYLGVPGNPPTLWRTDRGTSAPVPLIRWAGTGAVGWGNVDEASVDAAVSLLHLELGDLAAACEHAPTLAAAVLAAHPAGGGFMVTAAELSAGAGLPPPDSFGARARPASVDETTVFVFSVSSGPVRDAIELWASRAENETVVLGVDIDELAKALDVDQALEVCRHLQVSPHDLWAPADAEMLVALGARA